MNQKTLFYWEHWCGKNFMRTRMSTMRVGWISMDHMRFNFNTQLTILWMLVFSYIGTVRYHGEDSLCFLSPGTFFWAIYGAVPCYWITIPIIVWYRWSRHKLRQIFTKWGFVARHQQRILWLQPMEVALHQNNDTKLLWLLQRKVTIMKVSETMQLYRLLRHENHSMSCKYLSLNFVSLSVWARVGKNEQVHFFTLTKCGFFPNKHSYLHC